MRENSYVENFKSLSEYKNHLAEKEAKKLHEATAAREAFDKRYHVIKDMRERKLREHGAMMEAARNDALSTIVKAIYITAMNEQEALTDEGIILAESMVDTWIKESGGASKILGKVGNDSYLLSRITQLVEDTAAKEVEATEKADKELTDASKEEKEPSQKQKKEDALSAAKEFLKDAGTRSVNDFIGKVVGAAQSSAVKKAEDKEEEKAAEEEAPEEVEGAEKEAEADAAEVEADTKEDEAKDAEVEKDEAEEKADEAEIEADTKEDEAKDAEIEKDEAEEKADEAEIEKDEAEAQAAEDKEEAEETEDDVKEAEEEDDDIPIEDIPAEDEDVEPTDSENGTPDTDPDKDSENNGDEDEDQSTEAPEDDEEDDSNSLEDADKEVTDDEVDDELGSEPLDDDGIDSDTTIDGDTENNGQIFDDLEKEDDVQKAIETIKTRVADAEETFIRNNAEDKKKMDEILSKISANVKTVEDLAGKDKKKEEVAQEHIKLGKRKYDSVINERNLTIFEKMTRKLGSGVIKNAAVKESYVTESGALDVDKVVESAKIMYGFLETLNTLRLDNVNEKYILHILEKMD